MPQTAQKTREIYVCIDTYLIGEIPRSVSYGGILRARLTHCTTGGRVDPCDLPKCGKVDREICRMQEMIDRLGVWLVICIEMHVLLRVKKIKK